MAQRGLAVRSAKGAEYVQRGLGIRSAKGAEYDSQGQARSASPLVSMV